MALRQLIYYPDEILTRPSEPVTDFGPELQTLVADMAETMYAAKGLGLAANQVGVPLRLVVVDVGQREDEPARLRVFANARILEQEGKESGDEGCLSFPGITVEVARATRVKVAAQDEHGATFEVEADGMFAVALQHELDHLDGVTLIDHLGRLSRKLALRRYKRALAERLAGGGNDDDDDDGDEGGR